MSLADGLVRLPIRSRAFKESKHVPGKRPTKEYAMFTMIPAPLRVFKTWSMILLILDGILNLAGVMINALSDAHYISPATFGIVNIVFGFVIGAVRFVKQEISATTEQKKELIAAAAEQPVTQGHQDVAAVVVKTGDVPTVAQPLTPAENTERLKTFIEMTVAKMISDALASRDKARRRKPSKPRAYHQVPVAMGAPETPK